MSVKKMSQEEIQKKAAELESSTAQETLGWALKAYGNRIALASSFGAEDVVVIDMMVKVAGAQARVFTLDTGRLNQETYDVMDRVRDKYGIRIESYFPQTEAVEKMERERGFNLFYSSIENRKLCCGIRKIEPLGRALSQLDGWITGLRRQQSVTRTSIAKLELDSDHGNIIKLNPIIDWTRDQVWAYIKENKVPYNKLHDQGYPSIGCQPCTRAVKPGEDERAGRWWWERPEQKECGLHVKKAGSH